MPTLSLAIDARRARIGASEFEQATGRVTRGASSALRGVLALGGGISAAFVVRGVIRDIAAFEQGLVGVGKTTDILGADLKALGGEILEMSTRIPVATAELLDIAQAAGQLGVRGSANLLKFTDTVAKLGTASDLAGDEAATTLARLLTVTGENVASVDALGSVIVRLGNEFAATESEIAAVATRVAQSTAAFEVSSAEAVALGAALKTVGIEAERGGTAIGKAFKAIDAAVRSGGESLDTFGEIAGVSGAEFARAYSENNTRGFQLFIEGLTRIRSEGGDVIGTLKGLGLGGERSGAALATLAKRSDELTRALDTAADELSVTTALEIEAARGADTLSGDWQRLLNTVKALSVETGDAGLIGSLRGVVSTTTDVIRVFAGLDSGFAGSEERARALADGLKAVGAGATAFVGVRIVASLAATATGLLSVGAAAGTASVGFGALAISIAPVTALALVVGGLVAAVVAIDSPAERAAERMRELTLSLSEAAEATGKVEAAQVALNAALESGDFEARRRALLGEIDAVEGLIDTVRELQSVSGSEARVELDLVTNIEGIDRRDVQLAIARELGGDLDVDLKLGEGVTADFARQVADVLGNLPDLSIEDVDVKRAPLELAFTSGAPVDQREAQILRLRDGIEELVKSTGSAEGAINALIARVGLSDSLPAEAGIDALIGRQRELAEQRRELQDTDTGSTERAAELATEAEATRTATVQHGELRASLLGVAAAAGVEAAQGFAELTARQDAAREATQQTIDSLQFETTLIGQSANEREISVALRRAESAAVAGGLTDFGFYLDQIREEIELQQTRRAELEAVRAAVAVLPTVLGAAFGSGLSAAKEEAEALVESIEAVNPAAESLANVFDRLRIDTALVGANGFDQDLQRGLIEVSRLAEQAGLDAQVARDHFEAMFAEFENQARAFNLARGITDPLVRGIESAIFRARDLQDVLKQIVQEMGRNVFRQLALQPLQEQLTGALQDLFAGGDGEAADTATATARATIMTKAAATASLTLTTGAVTAGTSIADGGTAAGAALITAATTAAAILASSSAISGAAGLGAQVGGQAAIGALTGNFGGLVSVASANGNVFEGGSVVPFANGGVIDRPISFPLNGGRTGIAGEAGPEGIFPLERKNGKLGIAASGGGATTINFNFPPGTDAKGFRDSERQISNKMRGVLRRSR